MSARMQAVTYFKHTKDVVVILAYMLFLLICYSHIPCNRLKMKLISFTQNIGEKRL